MSNAELLTVSRISRAHWCHLELMLLIFNPLWSVSEALVVVVWKSLELWVHFCCISFPCGETCSELWDLQVAIPGFNRAEFSIRSFRRDLSVWQNLCRTEAWAEPSTLLLQSLPIYTNSFHEISLCFAWRSLSTTAEILPAFLFREYYTATHQNSALEPSQRKHWR